MRFRRAEVRDLFEIVEIAAKEFPYIKNPVEFFLKRIHDGNIILARDGELLGFVDFTVDGDTLQIDGLVVKERYRRLGIGRALLTRALEEGRKMKLRRARLMTLRSNTAARHLYESLGFRVIGEEGDVLFYERDL